MQHPINAYRLIKSVYILNKFKKQFDDIQQKHQQNYIENIDNYNEVLALTEVAKTVNGYDLEGALRALVVLIHTYNIKADMLQHGIISTAHINNNIKGLLKFTTRDF